jgi:hypothetical protein
MNSLDKAVISGFTDVPDINGDYYYVKEHNDKPAFFKDANHYLQFELDGMPYSHTAGYFLTAIFRIHNSVPVEVRKYRVEGVDPFGEGWYSLLPFISLNQTQQGVGSVILVLNDNGSSSSSSSSLSSSSSVGYSESTLSSESSSSDSSESSQSSLSESSASSISSESSFSSISESSSSYLEHEFIKTNDTYDATYAKYGAPTSLTNAFSEDYGIIVRLNLSNNSLLETIDGSGLPPVMQYVYAYECPSLTSLLMPDQVSGAIDVHNNSIMTTLELPLYTDGSIDISGCNFSESGLLNITDTLAANVSGSGSQIDFDNNPGTSSIHKGIYSVKFLDDKGFTFIPTPDDAPPVIQISDHPDSTYDGFYDIGPYVSEIPRYWTKRGEVIPPGAHRIRYVDGAGLTHGYWLIFQPTSLPTYSTVKATNFSDPLGTYDNGAVASIPPDSSSSSSGP